MDRPTEHALTFCVHGPIARADLPGLSARVCALLERSGTRVARCDVRTVLPDAVTVEALARMQLAAHRTGCTVVLENASAELVDLFAFMGLGEVLTER